MISVIGLHIYSYFTQLAGSMFESDSGILTSHSGYGSSDYSSRMSEEWVIR